MKTKLLRKFRARYKIVKGVKYYPYLLIDLSEQRVIKHPSWTSHEFNSVSEAINEAMFSLLSYLSYIKIYAVRHTRIRSKEFRQAMLNASLSPA